MHQLLRRSSIGLLLVLAMSATMASAQVDVELAFDPAVASPGDEVTFSSSIEHFGTEAAKADVALTFQFGAFEFGPITGTIPLAAGYMNSSQSPFVAPPFPMTMQITMAITVGEFTDTSTASLTIEAGDFPMPFASKQDTEAALRNLGLDLAGSILDETTAVEDESFGEVKNRYRK